MKSYKQFNQEDLEEGIIKDNAIKMFNSVKKSWSNFKQRRDYNWKKFSSGSSTGVNSGKSKYQYLNAMMTTSFEDFVTNNDMTNSTYLSNFTKSFLSKNKQDINSEDGSDIIKTISGIDDKHHQIYNGISVDLNKYDPVGKSDEDVSKYIDSVYSKADDKIKKMNILKPK